MKKIDRYYYLFCIFHLCSIITSMSVTSRIFIFQVPYTEYVFYLTGGLIFIPFVFFAQDIVTEIYGYYNAQKMLYINLFLFSFYVIVLFFLSNLPFENTENNFNIVVSTLPRHASSFIVSLAISGKINNFILFKSKLIFNEKFLALRFIASTAIGQAFFQIIAVTISWYGSTNSITNVIPLAMFSYSYKILFEILLTPLNILICNNLKNLYKKEYQNVC